MSFEYFNVLDPRLGCMEYVQKDLKFGLFKGGINTNWTQIKSNNASSSSVNWSFNTQSDKAIIDRRMYVKIQFEVAITGNAYTTTGGTNPTLTYYPLLNDQYDAPRAFPLESVTQTISCSINGGSLNCIYRDAMRAQERFNLDYDLQQYDLSQIPNFLDNYQLYQDGANGVLNPLGTYDDSAFKNLRGSFPYDEVINPITTSDENGTTAIVKFTVCTPIMISPFCYSSQKLESGLINVKTMAINYNLQQIERVWCHAIPQTVNGLQYIQNISSFEVKIVGAPYLLVNYINPPLLDANQYSINKPVYYNYFRNDVYINNPNQSVQSGKEVTVTNQAIQIGTVPKCIYIYVCRQQEDQDYSTTDTFLPITKLSLQYLNVSGQFSSMTQNDLYNLNVKNGYKGSWNEFVGKTYRLAQTSGENTLPYVPLCGGPIRISAEDLSIPDNLAPGVNTNSQLIYNVTFENVNPETINYQIVTIVCQEGIMTIDEGAMSTSIGFITSQDVIKTREGGKMMTYSQNKSLYGGSWMTNLKSFSEDVLGLLRKVKPALKVLAPHLVEVGEQFGYGQLKKRGRPKKGGLKSKSKSKSKGGSKKYRKSRSKSRGGIEAGQLYNTKIGGRLISRSDIKRRLGH